MANEDGLANELWVANLDWRFDGAPLFLGAGRTPEEALSALVAGAVPVFGAEWLRHRDEEIGVRLVKPGQGYVLAASDGLWQEEGGFINGSDDRLEAAWTREPPAPGETFWLVEGETSEHGFKLQGWGATAESALAGLMSTWANRYAPMTGAEPAYLAEIADSLRLHEVRLGRGRSIPLGACDLTSTDPRFEGTWAEYMSLTSDEAPPVPR